MHSEFQSLLRRSVANVELLEMLRKIDAELASTEGSLKFWSNTAVILQALLMCGNILVNAFPAPSPRTLYQKLVLVAVEAASSAGGGASNAALSAVLDGLKKAVIEAVEKKGREFVPGVKILFGLMEDFAKLMETAVATMEGKDEVNAQRARIRNQIARAEAELMRIGPRLDDLTRKAQRIGTMA